MSYMQLLLSVEESNIPQMQSLLSDNPWLVGLGAGIASGFIVNIASRFIFSRGENKEYLRKLAAANGEVLYALRATVSSSG